MGIAATVKVICSSNYLEKLSLIQPGNREWVTVVECCWFHTVQGHAVWIGVRLFQQAYKDELINMVK